MQFPRIEYSFERWNSFVVRIEAFPEPRASETRIHNLETMQGLQGTKIALLIDFDNVILGVEDPGFDVELVVNTLRSRGVVVMGRAYGDWYRHHRHRRKLMEQGIELVETPVFGPLIKNSADIRIVIDGLDIAAAHSHIDTFCLVSGDSDFLPLIKRLQLLGKHVIVIAGVKFTSDLVRRNCNEYLAYENLLAESVGATEDASTLEGSFHLLERAIITLTERGMDVRSSTVKQMMLQLNPAFSERTFGCYQFKQFLDKASRADIVQVSERTGVSGEHDVLLSERILTMVREAPVRSSTQSDAAPRETARPERRSPTARGGRGRSRATNADEKTSEIVPVIAPIAERENVANAVETPSAPVNVAPKSNGVAAISASSLASRPGLRRGRLRFSAKVGGTTFEPQSVNSSTESSTISTESSGDAAESSTRLPGETPLESGNLNAETSLNLSSDEVVASVDSTLENDVTTEIVTETESTDEVTTPAKRRGTRGGRRRRGAKTEAETALAESMTHTEGGISATTPADYAALHQSGANAVELKGEFPVATFDLQSALLENTESPIEILPGENVSNVVKTPVGESATDENSSAENAVAEPKKRTSRGRRGGAKKAVTAKSGQADAGEVVNAPVENAPVVDAPVVKTPVVKARRAAKPRGARNANASVANAPSADSNDAPSARGGDAETVS